MHPGENCIIDVVARPRHGLTDRDRQTETDTPRHTHRDRQTKTDRPKQRLRQTERDRQLTSWVCSSVCPARPRCSTDRDRQTETRLSPVNISSRLREHKLLVPGSASAGCCRAGRVLMTHFSHIIYIYIWMCVCMYTSVCVCVYMFSFTLRGRLRPRSGVNIKQH